MTNYKKPDILKLEYDTWLWLIKIKNHHLHFGEDELSQYNQITGYIGLFNGLFCYVIKK